MNLSQRSSKECRLDPGAVEFRDLPSPISMESKS